MKKNFFGSYGWSIFLGILAGAAYSKELQGVVALLLLAAVVTAVYKEYRVERSGARKAVGMLLALVISPVLFEVSAKIMLKILLSQ